MYLILVPSTSFVGALAGDLYIIAVIAIAHDGWQDAKRQRQLGQGVLCWRTPIGSRTYSDPDGSALVDFKSDAQSITDPDRGLFDFRIHGHPPWDRYASFEFAPKQDQRLGSFGLRRP